MDWLSHHAWAGWLVLSAALAAAEMASLDLVLVMLAVGALGGAVVAGLGGPFLAQVLVAAAAAIGMLALVRPPVVKRLHSGPDLVLGHNRLVGSQGVVTTAITPHDAGQVRLGGDVWTASPYDPMLEIPAGATVEVLAIRGATAMVHPIEPLD